MFLVIPLIELKEGQAVYCIRGEEGTDHLYSKLQQEPGELCKLLRRENSKSVHISDLDSFEKGDPYLNKEIIFKIVDAVDIPIQLYSSFKNIDDCRYYLDRGVYRIYINDLLIKQPEKVRELIEEYTSSRIAFAAFTDKSKLAHNIDEDIDINSFIHKVNSVGGSRILYYNDDWKLSGKINNIDLLLIAYKQYGIRFTLFEAVNSAPQLWDIQEYKNQGIDSVVLGNSIYNNNFPCQKIWRLIEAEIEKVSKIPDTQ